MPTELMTRQFLSVVQSTYSINGSGYYSGDFRVSELVIDNETEISFGEADYSVGGAFSSQNTFATLQGQEVVAEAVFDTSLDMGGMFTSLGLSVDITSNVMLELNNYSYTDDYYKLSIGMTLLYLR